ncbi:tyrosine--tRNA ligase [Clostridium estertheticum]|uniref:tyrosine--tRNA ligase n=1 Tax=Clostridium estertheticum TaxID=238834 RepID=UPI001C7D0B76|nr:tyrosine--tRNA ligase [Clostridium estertheticum]MBX4265504.1 tyrosine--tRNA ligase [Clostridium estertheticum]MBX4271662.1 tyrosine--tRNA ligase [Clostridium estertheticum]WLC82162.1 tyrosine--tRNA ligase [Clostridium estertheticum]WLC91149.1 tyrosine--tRNA ligase [Clostridium estertheticum]
MINAREQFKIIMKGVNKIISEEDLMQKLEKSIATDIPLVVKLGLDPSAPDIHLGHAVVLRKIKQIQDLGHRAVIIIGDFTGKIGDPSGKSKTRKQLTNEQVIENAKSYEQQIFKILDSDKTDVKFNSEWLSKLDFEDVLKLAGKVTVARILERDDFEKRYKNNEPIGLHEFFYPLMQAYDSVQLKADIEMGGTDQTFNILMGRTMQKDYGQERQVALFMPLLEGTDGIQKMSKSLGNYIGIYEDAVSIYQKTMTIPDNLIIKYFELATDIHPDEIEVLKLELKKPKTNPRDVKMRLAKEITTLYCGILETEAAEEHFRTVFQKNLIPEDVDELILSPDCFTQKSEIDLIKVIVKSGIANSNNEARRLIAQNAVKIDGEKFNNSVMKNPNNSFVIQVGKAKFIKVKST